MDILDPAADAYNSWTAATAWAELERQAALEKADQGWRRSHPKPDRDWNDDELLFRLGGDPAMRTGMVHCPAHEDRQRSLSWRVLNGKLLLHCFAGCTFAEIVAMVR